MDIPSLGVKLAKTAGFCMGVKRAVDMALDVARSRRNGKIYTYGPLIHSPQTIELLQAQGVTPLSDLDMTAGERSTIIIRAHGISPQENEMIKARGFEIIDATCPKVSHVQAVIKRHYQQGFSIVILGDKDHPEVKGLLGYAQNEGIVISSRQEVDSIPALDQVCVVAQTTQDTDNYDSIVKSLRERFPQAVIFNTICTSTEMRQSEVKKLAREMEAMVVVGGSNSANTRRLAELSETFGAPTFHIETAADLKESIIRQYGSIGVSAGASTPNWIIDEVVDKISSFQNRGQVKVGSFFRLWAFAVKADIYAAIGAACLSLNGMVLQRAEVNVPSLFTASLYVYAMHTLNRYINWKATSIIGSFRKELFIEHERAFLTAAIMALIIALVLSFLSGMKPFILLIFISLLGAFYNIKIFPAGWRFRSIKDIPGSKNIFTALAWAVVVVVLPQSQTVTSITTGIVVAFIFTFFIVFIRSAMSDIVNMQSDRLIGRETLPVLMGEKRTMILVKLSTLMLLFMITVSTLAEWTSRTGILLLLCFFYIWICTKLCDRRSAFSGVSLEGMLETNYLLVGAVALLGQYLLL